MNNPVVRSVSWLVRQIASVTDAAPQLHNVVLEAEIFNFHAHSSGHWYFSLKDDYSRIDCTMWERDNLLVNFLPKNGDRVKVFGSVSVYTVQGKIQFTVRRMVIAGKGDLKAQFDALYRKLDQEGLFDPAVKKPVPKYPMRIGLVTGQATHARADVLNTLRRRWPIAEIFEHPALVQGEHAPAELIQALKNADSSGYDVILLCRGGGSMEDLWCFNDEALARTIFAMRTPVITGIGHEPDHTIADYAADLRAPTPTGAAEQASPDIRRVYADLRTSCERIHSQMHKRIKEEQNRIDGICRKAWYVNPESMIYSKRMEKDLLEEKFLRLLHTSSMRTSSELHMISERMMRAVHERIRNEEDNLCNYSEELTAVVSEGNEKRRNELAKAAGLLDAYSPLKVLSRGYSVVAKEDHVITDTSCLNVGDLLQIRMNKGMADAEVISITREDM